jgi:hypothetical protein
MSARLYIRNDAGSLEQIANFPSEGWTIEESAEEGNSSSSTIYIPDPDLAYVFTAHRRFVLYEDESEDTNEVLASGFVTNITVGRKGGEYFEPLGRVHTLQLNDMNTLWGNRILRGTDTDRSAETDVARMTWLVATEEMGYFDTTTYLSAANTANLDARDTARQQVKQVADECAQQAGKNYFIYVYGSIGSGSSIGVWYGKDSLEVYDSPLRLSNVATDWDDDGLADGSSLVWPISDGSEVGYSGERVYDGVSVEYEGGAVYRKNAATTAFFTLSGRDLSYPAPEIKSKTKAQARGDRVLADADEMDEVMTTTVRLPKAKASMIRAGMRIPVRASHMPGWEDYGWARILTCAYTAVQAGAFYDVTVKLQGPTSFIALQTVTLVATNTVVEDSTRNAVDSEAGITFVAGQVWRWTLTNTVHDSHSFLQDFALQWTLTSPVGSANVVRAWGTSVYYAGGVGYPTAQPAQSGPPYPTMPSDTGTFTVTASGTGTFLMYFNSNYGGAGSPAADEQLTCVLERLS